MSSNLKEKSTIPHLLTLWCVMALSFANCIKHDPAPGGIYIGVTAASNLEDLCDRLVFSVFVGDREYVVNTIRNYQNEKIFCNWDIADATEHIGRRMIISMNAKCSDSVYYSDTCIVEKHTVYNYSFYIGHSREFGPQQEIDQSLQGCWDTSELDSIYIDKTEFTTY